ncbi:MAG TPA: class I SAM-dependent methyltransferase [Gemmatimonadota bacterium]|nr:class I SAM-dependent methyltransferase [Gemmatimonadota bacterium]
MPHPAREVERKERDAVLNEYSRLAPVYDKRWSFYIEATTRATMARLSPPPNARVLDVGCGTGVLLQELAREFPQVSLVGLDPVPEMLAVARSRVPPGTELHEGWAEELPFADGHFDVVVSCNVLHYIRRPVPALMEVRRVLRPGGEVVITDWCADYLTCRICDGCLRLFRPAHFKVYGVRELLRLLEQAGHLHAQIERYKINWLWGLMTARSIKYA